MRNPQTYRKIPKISPGAYIFQRALFEGLIFVGAYIRRGICTEGNLRFQIDWASLYTRANSKYKTPGSSYSEGRFNGGFFRVTIPGGLYS